MKSVQTNCQKDLKTIFLCPCCISREMLSPPVYLSCQRLHFLFVFFLEIAQRLISAVYCLHQTFPRLNFQLFNLEIRKVKMIKIAQRRVKKIDGEQNKR